MHHAQIDINIIYVCIYLLTDKWIATPKYTLAVDYVVRQEITQPLYISVATLRMVGRVFVIPWILHTGCINLISSNQLPN